MKLAYSYPFDDTVVAEVTIADNGIVFEGWDTLILPELGVYSIIRSS